ncbi:MAG: TraB/GumN family protein [Hyphomicrobium sp.]
MRLRKAITVAFSAVLLLAGATLCAHAEDAATAQCSGADMLAELAVTDPAAHTKVVDQAKALGNTEALLWKVEKAGLKTSYLFGTMHLTDTRITTLSAKVTEALSQSEKLVLEVGDLSQEALVAAMAAAGADLIYADGRTLADQLTADEFAKVTSLVSASGMPGDFARMLKPWLVSTLLSMSECERRQVASGRKVLDMKLAEVAKGRNIPVVGLESINEQLNALSGVPEDQQIQMLRVGLKYADRTDDMMETMLQMYLTRRMGEAMPFQVALASKIGVPATAFDGFQKSLLVDRNARMSKTAAPILEKGNAFIAVGALHLPGKTGLVTLLRTAGYTVTAVE